MKRTKHNIIMPSLYIQKLPIHSNLTKINPKFIQNVSLHVITTFIIKNSLHQIDRKKILHVEDIKIYHIY